MYRGGPVANAGYGAMPPPVTGTEYYAGKGQPQVAEMADLGAARSELPAASPARKEPTYYEMG